VTKIRSFMGLAGYYRRFIEGFFTITSPITRLTRKEVKFEWSKDCEASFQELKFRLTSAQYWPYQKDRRDLLCIAMLPVRVWVVYLCSMEG